MAKQAKKQKFELATLDANNIVELDGWKAKQESVIKENPFIEIVDRETYEIAKTRRTALVSARTEIQKQDKFIGSVMSKFRKQTIAMAKDLIGITEPHEEKQQSEVSRYEEILEAKRQEKELAEQKRVDDIKNKISHIKSQLQLEIDHMKFETMNECQNVFNHRLNIDFNFEEYEPMFDEMVSEMREKLDETIVWCQKTEEKRLEQLEKDQEAEVNRRGMKCQKLIDNVDLENKDQLIGRIEKIMEEKFDFGVHQEYLNDFYREFLQKAKWKINEMDSQIERQKEIQMQENKNRIMNVREGLLDRIFQMTTDDYESHLEYIKNALDQENPFPELKDEFNKMIQIVKMNLDSKLNIINNEIVERLKQAREARIAIDARTAQRGKQLEKIGFIFNEQKTENFWNTLVSDFEVWESMVEGLSDEDWTPYFNKIKKSMEDAKAKNKAHQERQKRLKDDKANMIKILTAKKLPGDDSFLIQESKDLWNEIRGSFELFMKTKIETINKF